jgi:hypothetical protein
MDAVRNQCKSRFVVKGQCGDRPFCIWLSLYVIRLLHMSVWGKGENAFDCFVGSIGFDRGLQ